VTEQKGEAKNKKAVKGIKDKNKNINNNNKLYFFYYFIILFTIINSIIYLFQ
jgi:hypothetical protein